ncbi:ABC transporter permease [Dactylosporangium roseum]
MERELLGVEHSATFIEPKQRPVTRLRAFLAWAPREIAGFLGALLLISFVTFIAVRVVSGDIALKALGREATPGQLSAFRETHGLDDPMLVQYWDWLRGFVSGNWGQDLISGRGVFASIVSPFAYTVVLAVAALAASIPLSMILGVASALRMGDARDRTLMTMSIVTVATPEFVIAVGGILVFGVWLKLLPVDSTALTYEAPFLDKFWAFLLPWATLVIALTAYFYRVARASCYDVLKSKYVEAARLRGFGQSFLIRRYVIRNSAGPLINAVAIGAVHLIGGVVLVEQVFGYPGLGQALIQTVTGGSLKIVQAIVVVLAAVFLLIGAVADLAVKYVVGPTGRQSMDAR